MTCQAQISSTLPCAGENNTNVHIAYENVYLKEFYKGDRQRNALYNLGLVFKQFNTGFVKDVFICMTFVQFKDKYEAGDVNVVRMVEHNNVNNPELVADTINRLVADGNIFCEKVEYFRENLKAWFDLMGDEEADEVVEHPHLKQAQEGVKKLVKRFEQLGCM